MTKYYTIPTGYATIAKNKTEALAFFNEHATTKLKEKCYSSYLEWTLVDISIAKNPSISTEMRGRDIGRLATLINGYELINN